MPFIRGLRLVLSLARFLLRRLPDDRAVLFFDAIKNMRRARAPAAVWENRVSECEFAERDLAAAEKRGWERAERRMNSRRAAELKDGSDSPPPAYAAAA